MYICVCIRRALTSCGDLHPASCTVDSFVENHTSVLRQSEHLKNVMKRHEQLHRSQHPHDASSAVKYSVSRLKGAKLQDSTCTKAHIIVGVQYFLDFLDQYKLLWK